MKLSMSTLNFTAPQLNEAMIRSQLGADIPPTVTANDGCHNREVRPALDINSRVFIQNGDKCSLILLQSIQYFESCKNHVQIFFDKGNSFIKKPLSNIEERLPKGYFLRINRQHIVNLQAISRIEESVNLGYTITLMCGKSLDISRRSATELKELLSF